MNFGELLLCLIIFFVLCFAVEPLLLLLCHLALVHILNGNSYIVLDGFPLAFGKECVNCNGDV